jgi:hypothetical protein
MTDVSLSQHDRHISDEQRSDFPQTRLMAKLALSYALGEKGKIFRASILLGFSDTRQLVRAKHFATC